MDLKQFKHATALVIGGALGWFITHLVWTRWAEIKSAVRALFGA